MRAHDIELQLLSAGPSADSAEAGGDSLPLLRTLEGSVPRPGPGSRLRVACGVEAARVLFIAVVSSVVAGEAVFFYWCFALSHCYHHVGAAAVLVPIFIGASALSVLCSCVPPTVQTLWCLPEGCALAWTGCRSCAARIKGMLRRAWNTTGAKSDKDLHLWATSLPPDKQKRILSESEQSYQVQDWKGAIRDGRALAVVRALHRTYLTEARPAASAACRQWACIDGWQCGCGVNVVPQPTAAQDPGVCAWQEELDARCDGCGIAPISGRRFRCTECANFDLCSACYNELRGGLRTHAHGREHFIEVSSNCGSCCNCATHVRAWPMSHYEERACVMCKGRKLSACFSRIGLAHKHLGQLDTAIEVLEERLKISKEWGDKAGETEAHGNLAICFRAMGPDMVDKAAEHAQQQLRGAQELRSKRAEAAALQHLAEAHELKRDYMLAIEKHEQCLAIASGLGGEDCVLQMPSAITPYDYYHQEHAPYSTVTLKEGGHKKYEALVLHNLASCYYRIGKYARALELDGKASSILSRRAIELRGQVDVKIEEYRSQQMHGNTFRDQFSFGGLMGLKWGDVSAGSRARELQRQLDRAFLGEKYLEGEICAGLGRCYTALGQHTRALELHQKHWDLALEAGDKASQAAACNDLGDVLQLRGELSEAARILGRGLAAYQRVERDVGAHDDRRVAIFEKQQKAYMLLQSVLLGLGQAGWALGVAEQAKARALSRHLGAGTGDEVEEGVREDGYEDMCRAWWEEVHEQACGEAEGGGGEGVRILEYSFLFDDRMAIWVLSGEGALLHSTTVPTSQLGGSTGRTIEKLLEEARKSMKVRGRDAMSASGSPHEQNSIGTQSKTASEEGATAAARAKVKGLSAKEEAEREADLLGQLYQALIAPVESALEGAQEVLIVPHKELFEVPWAALIDADGRYLIERHVLRVAPSLRVASQAAANVRQPGAKKGHVVVVGNPRPTLLCDLPFAEKEAEAVEKILEQADIDVQREHFFRADRKPKATKANIKKALQGADWAHLALHGDKEKDALIVALPEGNRGDDPTASEMTMREIQGGEGEEGVRLRQGATAVLSACNTGRGEIKAEGVVGLARGFLLAGAAATVVSLWSVADRSTSKLMECTYKRLAATDCTAPEALRFAMLRLAGRSPAGHKDAPEPTPEPGPDVEQGVEGARGTSEGEWIGGFRKVEGGGSRDGGGSEVVPVVEGFLNILEGVGSGSRDAGWATRPAEPGGALRVHETDQERMVYWREFCERNVTATCVADFPYEDQGGLGLAKEPVDERLLERIYCFEDLEDDTHLVLGGRRRRVLLKVHTLLKWRDRGDKLFLRAAKVTSAKVMYAYWNPELKMFQQEQGKGAWLKLLPVSESLQDTWRKAYTAGRRAEIEWEWRKSDCLPAGEDKTAPGVTQRYFEVREAIKMGERLFPKGASPGAMKGHGVWKEAHGVFQTNKMLRDAHEVEYEVFVSADVADGLEEVWKRPMHWAGFLVVGASTRLPRRAADEPSVQTRRAGEEGAATAAGAGASSGTGTCENECAVDGMVAAATHFCQECQHWLCQVCAAAHGRAKKTKGHTLVACKKCGE